jgi:hypothetical protein
MPRDPVDEFVVGEHLDRPISPEDFGQRQPQPPSDEVDGVEVSRRDRCHCGVLLGCVSTHLLDPRSRRWPPRTIDRKSSPGRAGALVNWNRIGVEGKLELRDEEITSCVVK